MIDIFVFGSNASGRHGKGAALAAMRHHGAIYGQGEGIQGRSHAIPTKDRLLRPLSIDEIARNVERFIAYARTHPRTRFVLTAVGCGLAGYTPAAIAPLFRAAPSNVVMPAEFAATLAPRETLENAHA